MGPPPSAGDPPAAPADELVHITRLTEDRRQRVYLIAGHQHGRRKLTTDKAEAEVFTRERAEFLIGRGRPDRRYKPRIEEA